MISDTNTKRKYLNNKHNCDSWLLAMIKRVCDLPSRILQPSGFMFEDTMHAAKHNASIIEEHKFDMCQAIAPFPDSAILPGSEFRTTTTLQQIWGQRFDWDMIRDILEHGCRYPIPDDPDEHRRLDDLHKMVEQGNHKSATIPEHVEVVRKTYQKEIARGWVIPIPLPTLFQLRHADMTPIGIATQFTVNEAGEKILKKRLTHDFSFPVASGTSVNIEHVDNAMEECLYGYCFKRILHRIHALRIQYPETPILAARYDLDAAYRSLHVLIEHTVRSTTVVNDMAYIPLRLPFGVAAGPGLYSTVSEAIFDLTNDILSEQSWDHLSLKSPHNSALESPDIQDEEADFAIALPLAIPIPTTPTFCDGYIDDIICVSLATDDFVARCQAVAPLAAHTIFRLISDREPIERDDPLSLRKLAGKDRPSETKTILGWIVCTRSFKVYLPPDKSSLMD